MGQVAFGGRAMTQRRDSTSKYKIGSLPTIRAGFIYTKAMGISISPLPVTSCGKCSCRRSGEFRHSQQTISAEGRGTTAKWGLANGGRDDSF